MKEKENLNVYTIDVKSVIKSLYRNKPGKVGTS